MPSTSSKSFLKTSFKSPKKSDNSSILVVLGIFLFIIIVGVIIFGAYKNREFFTNTPNKLVYLYMNSCGFCKEFTPIWEEMTTEVNKNPTTYKLTMEKYDLNDKGQGTKLSQENNVDYAPAVILITPAKNFLYEGERTKEAIYKWVSSKVA